MFCRTTYALISSVKLNIHLFVQISIACFYFCFHLNIVEGIMTLIAQQCSKFNMHLIQLYAHSTLFLLGLPFLVVHLLCYRSQGC